MLIRAIIKDGKLYPLDPLPEDWMEGRTVELQGYVEPPDDPESLEKHWEVLEALIAQTPHDPEDDQRIQEIIDEQKRLSKEYVRRQMGLSS
jgi:hypothetical protein